MKIKTQMPCLCENARSQLVIAAVFSECVGSPAEYATFVFGWLSIAFWVVAIYPQIRLNFCNKEAEALSAWFILQWFGGDLCNTLSTFLLRLLFTYQFLAVFYVATDMIILGYMIYYHKKAEKRPINPKIHTAEAITYGFLLLMLVAIPIAYGVPAASLLYHAPQLFANCASGHVYINKATEIAGTVMSYLTIPLYGFGRPFQIYKNYKRKSVEGLSIGLFLCTFGGNITYFASLLAAIIGGIKRGVDQAPFIVSSLWPAVCDVIILCQFYYYRHRYKLLVPYVLSIAAYIEKVAS